MTIIDNGQEKTPIGIIWPILQKSPRDAPLKPLIVEGNHGDVRVQVAVIDGLNRIQFDRFIEMTRGLAPQVLCSAILIDSADADPQALDMLMQTCDVVVLASADNSMDTAQQLVRVLTLPSEPNSIWCTDWNDVYAIATKPRAVKPARLVCAHAYGPYTRTVVEQAMQGISAESPLNALVLLRIGKEVCGAQVKEVHSTVRDRFHCGSGLVKSTVFDASLADDEAALDILVFGSLPDADNREAGNCISMTGERDEGQSFEIPAFLRTHTP